MKSVFDHFRPSVAKPDPGVRNSKGERRPDHPVTYAPLLVWPPQPIKLVKWVVIYPGYMWPRNLVLLAISTVSWLWLQPNLARCAEFKWDWIGLLLLRNQALIWLVYGGYHFGLPQGTGANLPEQHKQSAKGGRN